MTGDERLAKVAEVLHGSRDVNLPMDDPLDVSCRDVAQALGPLLEEFRAEDEARALREVADDLRQGRLGLDNAECAEALDERAALAAAEPDAGAR